MPNYVGIFRIRIVNSNKKRLLAALHFLFKVVYLGFGNTN